MSKNNYESPFCTRYASEEMQYVFSPDNKFKTWRKLWIALAKAEQRQGLGITDEQIAELEAHAEDINYDVAQAREKECRHDVMSHVYAYGVQCPHAKGIIHLGATSCYVGDNTDIILMRQGLTIVRRKLLNVISLLAAFADRYKDMPALAYTHLQPAQLTTVGKRATLWINELMMDLEETEYRIAHLKLLGSKGTTGTQASFVELFEGNGEKIKALEEDIAKQMGFDAVVPVSGQTYSRKVDSFVMNVLAGIAQSASKFSNDLRLLANFKEMEEPFEAQQIGSSAMPYKRNPMRSERITSLSRYVMSNSLNPQFTAATQWFERTLDDSANKRIAMAEAFLAVDAILKIMLNVCDGLVVYPKVIAQRVMRELPFMATENIMMSAVKKGGDRQELHERLRQHSIAAANVVKQEGGENDLIQRVCQDPAFGLTREELEKVLEPKMFIGRSSDQVKEYLQEFVNPVLEANRDLLGERAQLSV
ncbi:MAG: adenylosuccinate lyase [Oscillospiraceae bacterium]|nr:adenylosuccinate lyase [Oscillospiraceae bacterium]MCI9363422.1 adenylosuccinate lyase [Oscillospiraceae bacterium]MCI9669026.1 adenylosuccinate lyase [Oscillospiraceae bacterium]RKJ56046.1 adenylosuccinate lyase [bacterium 1XD42-8]RKJ65762.1 adenylosuccinate lyase [bacterium 1XD42-1]